MTREMLPEDFERWGPRDIHPWLVPPPRRSSESPSTYRMYIDTVVLIKSGIRTAENLANHFKQISPLYYRRLLCRWVNQKRLDRAKKKTEDSKAGRPVYVYGIVKRSTGVLVQ